MFASVIADQLGRTRAHGGVGARLGDLTTVSRLNGYVPLASWSPRASRCVRSSDWSRCVPGVAASAARRSFWCLRSPLPCLAAPSWFFYYCDYLAVALALVVGGAAAAGGFRRTARRESAAAYPRWPSAATTATTLGAGRVAPLSVRRRGPARACGGARARCVMSDSPMAQIELDALSRGLAVRVPELDRRERPHVRTGPGARMLGGSPGRSNARWQRDFLGATSDPGTPYSTCVLVSSAGTRAPNSGVEACSCERAATPSTASPGEQECRVARVRWAVPGTGLPLRP